MATNEKIRVHSVDEQFCEIFTVRTIVSNSDLIRIKNIDKIIAISYEPCNNVLGVREIDRIKELHGDYFEKWVIRKEDKGYIFREVNHSGGINGHHKTLRQLIIATAKCYPVIKVVFKII